MNYNEAECPHSTYWHHVERDVQCDRVALHSGYHQARVELDDKTYAYKWFTDLPRPEEAS